MPKVLFVCLGNICRSPIAEAVFVHLVQQHGLGHEWEADSAAIGGWHVGNPPERRARSVLSKYGIEYNGRARQIDDSDFIEFDFIFGMDENNISNLKGDAPSHCKEKIQLLGNFDPDGVKIIRDPYYDSGSEGFEQCYQQCLRCCTAFLKQYL